MNSKKSILDLFILIILIIFSIKITLANEIKQKNYNYEFEKLQNSLSKAKDINGKFIQERKIKVLSNPLISKGYFSLSRNKGLSWVQEFPFKSTLTLNSKTLIQKIGNNNPMVLTKEKQPFVFSFSKIFLSIFKGDKKNLEQTFQIEFTGNSKKWTMTLFPKSSPLNKAIKSVKLIGDKVINDVIVNNIKDDKLKIKFYDVKVKD